MDVIGQTPAHYSVLYGNLQALNELGSGNLDKANVVGHTPLYYAKILLGTFSGFRNDYMEGLPTPAYRRRLEEIARTLQSSSRSAKSLELSPYPLPPLLPSEFLCVPAPIAQVSRQGGGRIKKKGQRREGREEKRSIDFF